jgi:hypothetical protein
MMISKNEKFPHDSKVVHVTQSYKINYFTSRLKESPRVVLVINYKPYGKGNINTISVMTLTIGNFVIPLPLQSLNMI